MDTIENNEQSARSHTQTRWGWFKKMAQTKHAEWWLGAYSFFETVILPFPTDPFLALMVFANRSRAVWLTFWTTLTSFLGSIFLYGLVVLLFEIFVAPLVIFFGMQELVTVAAENVAAYTFAAVFIGAFTPIPYTPVVIAAGLLRADFLLFALGAFLGRGIRYAIVSTLTVFFGVQILPRVGKIASLLTFTVIALFAVGWFAVTYIL